MSKKMLSRVLCTLALAFAAALAVASPAFAETLYTVRVLGGSQGTYDGQSVAVVGQFAYGEECTLDINKVAVNDGAKYYPKGFKVSGQDALAKVNFTVTEDIDFVVAYGVKGEMVEYTVRFVEYGSGNSLQDDQGRSSVTYEGKVGDKPVVAYSYVPGYRPLYENITGTLKAGENVWDLPYTPLVTETQQQESTQTQTQQQTQTTTETVVTETTTTTTPTTQTTTTTTTPTPTTTESTVTTDQGNQGGNAGNEGTQTGENQGNEGNQGTETPEPTTTDNPTVVDAPATTEPPATQEIYDVDNPLTAPTTGESTTPTDTNTGTGETSGNSNQGGGFVGPLFAALIAAAIAAIGAIIYFVLRRRNEANYDDEL